MTDQDLKTARREKWRLDGNPIRTIENARAFIESVGFAMMYPVRPAVLLPTFIGAFVGSDDRLPDWQHAFADPRAAEATELMVRLLRERAAYEANLFGENNAFLVAASAFPYFYALVGERNPKQPPKSGARSPYSPLACDAFDLIQRTGPVSKQKMQEALGGSVSFPALDKALGELWSNLRITRVDYNRSAGSFWDVLYRWAPDAVREGISLSVAEALSGLLSKYLEAAVAVEQSELEIFFGNFVPRSKVRDAVNALLAARELSFTQIAGRSMLQITPAKVAFDPAAHTAAKQERKERQQKLKNSAAAPSAVSGQAPASVRRASPLARRPFNKFRPSPRDANSRDGKPTGPKRRP
ncbi:MAG: hypothetical protein ABR921_05280 [Candidatus Sulfotelmatobacter sp.]|jgi:hypothetical protein